MSIKVLHVIDHIGYGGAPVVVKNIAERIGNKEIETFICSLRTNPKAMPINSRIINLTFHRYNPFAFLAIAKLCKKYDIDIIHAHLQKSVVSSLLAGYFCNAKIIIHEHGPILRGGTGCIYRLLVKVLASRASLAIANSQAIKKALQKVTGFKKELIPVVENFIDFSRFDCSLYDRQKIRNKLNIPENKIVVGFVGRLDVCKGLDLLVKAASILCGKENKYVFVIVGDGSERINLENMVSQLKLEEKIIFTGLSENPAEHISAFDIAVMPSRREAFGIAVVEFMRMKVPVIASSTGGLVELIENNKTGILLDKLDAEHIARAIEKLVLEESLRKSMADNAEIFSRKFNGDNQIKQIMDIYKMLGSKV